MATGLSPINRALNLVPRRAEKQQAAELRETFVDSGVAVALESIDHQVLYGRRGTGKTHALRYVQSTVQAAGDLGIYVDLRTIGSPDGLFEEGGEAPIERAGRLLRDLLIFVHNELIERALADDDLVADRAFVGALDRLDSAISSVVTEGDVEEIDEVEQGAQRNRSLRGKFSLGANPAIEVGSDAGGTTTDKTLTRTTTSGKRRVHLNFSEVATSLRSVMAALTSKRIWLLLDEWSSVPQDIQPLLAEFLVRCVLPLNKVSVKIAAIEQQSSFAGQLGGRSIGIEVGADVTANLNLDEFMVYEENEGRSREFFLGLIFKHLLAIETTADSGQIVRREADVLQHGFTDRRAFDELVRAAEGVPRDALNIAAKAGMRAGARPISVPDVRAAARQWFQTDKEPALRGRPNAADLLNWIIDEVIRQRRTRGFLVNQRSADSRLLLELFDARVLHLVRRGYSAQDEPGERYDVWVIDYGAYVDLINTKNEPETLLSEDADDGSRVDVPAQDLRAIRRSILDLGAFTSR